MRERPAAVLYGPLADTPVDPDVVLLRLTGRQLMVLHDALPGLRIEATVKSTGQTGVEMEALTAVTVAALTVHDMVKAVDKAIEIGGVRVILKDGGKSGRYEVAREAGR